MTTNTHTILNTLDAIEQRRAVKHYDPNHRMSKKEIEQLVSLAMLSPTSFNIQHWRFVAVTDPEQKAQLKAAAWGQDQVTDASVVFVLCADPAAWEQDPGRYWQNAPQEVQEMLVPMIGNFYRGKTQLQRDEAIRSTGIAGQTLMLAAKALGYDSVPMIGFDPDRVAQLINLPNGYIVSFMIAVGKALKPARDRGGQLPINEVMVWDQF